MPMIDGTQLLRTIDFVRNLFLKRHNLDPTTSAQYYVVYTISGCGSTFTSLLRDVQQILDYTGYRGRRELERGRELLLKDGMIAKILFHYKTNSNKEKKNRIFRGEQYLPVNPVLIYDDLSQRPDTSFLPTDLETQLLQKLGEYWKENFKEHGFLIEKGILTVYCAAPWLLFSLLNFLSIWKKEQKTLYILTSGTKWCRPPLFYPLTSALEEGLEMRVLLDTSKKTKELEQLKKMRQVEVRHLRGEEAITNRLTFAGSQYIVDMHKILGTEDKNSNYIATIYLSMEHIAKQFDESFENRWKNARPL